MFEFAVTLGTTVGLILLCAAVEHVAALERVTMRQRLPGIIVNVVALSLSTFVVWPMQKLLIASGLGAVVIIPLWDWLKPFGWWGYAANVIVWLSVLDFLSYWRHRAEHKWFWPIHAVHHSPHKLHAANSFGHPLQAVPSYLFVTLPMVVVQIDHAGTMAAISLVFGFLQLYIHSPVDVNFGLVGKVLVSPRFHRIHHSLEPQHFDKNFGIAFSLWDRLFGTAYEPGEQWPAVGVADVAPPRGVWDFVGMPVSRFLHTPKGDSGDVVARAGTGEGIGYRQAKDVRGATPDRFQIGGRIGSRRG